MSAPHCVRGFSTCLQICILNQNVFDSGEITILVKEHLEKHLNSSVRRIHTVNSLKGTVSRDRFQKI